MRRGGGVEQRTKKKGKLTDTDNTVVIAGGRWAGDGEGAQGVLVVDSGLAWGGEHAAQCAGRTAHLSPG